MWQAIVGVANFETTSKQSTGLVAVDIPVNRALHTCTWINLTYGSFCYISKLGGFETAKATTSSVRNVRDIFGSLIIKTTSLYVPA